MNKELFFAISANVEADKCVLVPIEKVKDITTIIQADNLVIQTITDPDTKTVSILYQGMIENTPWEERKVVDKKTTTDGTIIGIIKSEFCDDLWLVTSDDKKTLINALKEESYKEADWRGKIYKMNVSISLSE